MADAKILQPPTIANEPFPDEIRPDLSPTQQNNSTTFYPAEIPDNDLPTPVVASEVFSAALNTQSKKILGGFSFGKSGAIQIGEYKAGVSGQLNMSSEGLTAISKNDGLASFAIGTDGNVIFKGTLKVGSTIEAGALTVGTNVGLGTAQTAGQVTTIIGNTVTTGYVNALNVNANTVNSSWVYTNIIQCTQLQAGEINANTINVTHLNADNLDRGVIYAGQSGRPSCVSINRNGSNGYLTWDGGNKIWSDGSQYMGLTANGERIYFYTGATLYALFQRYSQANFYSGIYGDGNLNITGDARINGSLKINASNNVGFTSNGASLNVWFEGGDYDCNFFKGGVIKAIVDDNFWTAGSLIAGAGKPFIIPHPDGSNRLLRYTAQESPEVILRHRGKVTLDSKGEAIVTLPTHYQLITEATGLVTVNLTPIGKFTPYLLAEATNKEIKIGGNSLAVVYYEVLAIRKGYLNSEVEIDMAAPKAEDQTIVNMFSKMEAKNKLAEEQAEKNKLSAIKEKEDTDKRLEAETLGKVYEEIEKNKIANQVKL